MDCCSRIAQAVLLVVNSIFLLIGGALIVMGSIILVREKAIIDEMGGVFRAMPILLLLVGFVTFVMAALGCCGALKQSECMLFGYTTLVGIVLLVEIILVIVMLSNGRGVEAFARRHLIVVFRAYNRSYHSSLIMDTMQKEFQCCGVDGPTDYRIYNVTQGVPPRSCCVKNSTALCNPQRFVGVVTGGCARSLGSFMRNNLAWTAAFISLDVIVQILAMVFACFLIQNIRNGFNGADKQNFH